MDFAIKFIIGGIIILGVAIIMSIERKKEKINYQTKTQFKIGNKNKETIKYKPISNKIFIYPILLFLTITGYKNLNSNEKETIQPNNIQQIQTTAPQTIQQINPQQIVTQTITRAQTPEEEQAYMQEHHLIKLGSEFHWCGIKESKDILPITKALDMDCENDFCRIQKYYNYVKRIPYEKGTQGKDKNAIEVMEEWKGDCDERSDLLASMMLANGYKTILLYTKDHTFTALNIPNYESNDNRAYVQYQGIKYYIAETTDPNGQIGAYNNDVMHNLKYIYDVNEKRVTKGEEIAIQLFK